jgi:hypothetical protein
MSRRIDPLKVFLPLGPAICGAAGLEPTHVSTPQATTMEREEWHAERIKKELVVTRRVRVVFPHIGAVGRDECVVFGALLGATRKLSWVGSAGSACAKG